MKYATDLGFHWGITTNGMLITDEIIEKMKDTKLATMSISIDGLEESHDNFRGIKGSYKKILENIEKLRQDKFLLNFIKEKRNMAKFDVTYGGSHFVGMKLEKELRNNMFFCMTGYTTASILYNGDIYVCPNVERRKDLIQGNVRKDDFIDIWKNKFKWFRDLDKLQSKECENCEDWKYCRGDSLHTWDFDKNKPKICIKKILEGGTI